ncbi:uncharacterized protein BCR38DRAFT_453068 [Pseudomassariella vexata]|uniref:Uncharacterized protein n=1 Tax=Pseudomassariella vexata TaxID=1141098 RepID=A0A1Y2D6S1_9PEZI|nr:uncharacterized protein BCR38DRAFT_453068 [Pseudomassariella vexata]ORY54979.1 hypothetical protein BCR38DRAFT_453068 [Pseudomassariella vexata]
MSLDGSLLLCRYDGWHEIGPHYIDEAAYNCDVFSQCDCPFIKADPDIAGIGVVAAFIVSIVFTTLATWTCLLLAPVADDTFNPIDNFFRKFICFRVQSWTGKERADSYLACSRDLVSSLSDQQLVTGIAILAAGLKKLSDGTITIYHFSIVQDLAWLSSNTHRLALVIFERFQDSVEPRTREKQKKLASPWPTRIPILVRYILNVTTDILLLYCCWVEGYEYWYVDWNCPASCTLSYPKGGEPLNWMIVNFFFILYTYPIDFFKLSKRARMMESRLRQRLLLDQNKSGSPSQSLSGPYRFSRTCSGFRQTISRLSVKVLRSMWIFFASETFAVLFQLVWTVVGCWECLADRISGQDLMLDEEIATEDKIADSYKGERTI